MKYILSGNYIPVLWFIYCLASEKYHKIENSLWKVTIQKSKVRFFKIFSFCKRLPKLVIIPFFSLSYSFYLHSSHLQNRLKSKALWFPRTNFKLYCREYTSPRNQSGEFSFLKGIKKF